MALENEHLKQFATEPEVVVRVPGVARIFGGFADYSKGHVICAAMDDSLDFSLSQRDDETVVIFNLLTGERKKFLIQNLKFRKEDHYANIIKGVIKFFPFEFEKGFDICLGGKVIGYNPDERNCAVALATVLALSDKTKLDLDNKAVTDLVLKGITSFCQARCSLATLLSMQNAREGNYIDYDFRKNSVSFIPDPFKNTDYSLVFTETGVSNGGMRDETEQIKTDMSFLSNKLINSLNPMTVMNLNSGSKRLAQYLIDETSCTINGQKGFLQKDFALMGKALLKNERALTVYLEFCCPETEWIIKRSSEMTGCLGSSIIFTGFDGVVAGIFKNDSLEVYKTKLVEFEHYFGTKVKYHVFVPERAATIEKG